MPRCPLFACAALLLAAAPAAAQATAPAGPGAGPAGRPGDRDAAYRPDRGRRARVRSWCCRVRPARRRCAAGIATPCGSRRRMAPASASRSRRADNTVRVRARTASGSRGPAGLVDYTITVPRWMAVSLSGTYLAAERRGRRRRGERRDRGRRHHGEGRHGRRHAALDRRRDPGRERHGQGAGHDGQRLDRDPGRVGGRHRRDDQRRRGGVELEGVEPRGLHRERRRALRGAGRATRASTG